MINKKLFIFIIPLIIGLVLFVLYKFNVLPNTLNNVENSNKRFSAKINGDTLWFDQVKACELKDSKMIIVTAKSSLDKIELMIPSTIDQGDYNFYDYFSNSNTIITGAYESTNIEGRLEGFKSNSKLTIVNHDQNLGVITGTFNSKTRTNKITEGEFSVKYK